MIATLAENIATAQERRLVRDAEAVLAVAAWADLPAGIAVLPMMRTDAGGMCIGSGRLLAVAHELPGVAVQVDVGGFVRAALGVVPEVEALAGGVARGRVEALAVDVVRRMAEAIAAHELAHALVAPLDVAASAAEAKAIVAACNSIPFPDLAECHHPRWAAALVILSRRMLDLRPAAERDDRLAIMRTDIGRYGLDADTIDAALGDVDADASVRELLAPGGAVADRVAAVCPTVAERRAYIEHRRAHGAAGVAGSISSEESERAE
jgi:hypothetical protein